MCLNPNTYLVSVWEQRPGHSLETTTQYQPETEFVTASQDKGTQVLLRDKPG